MSNPVDLTPPVAPTGNSRDLRRALGAFPTGVTVVTARSSGGDIAGLTINSFSSVSLDPPLVLWCLSERAPSRAVFANASHFAIHVLAQDQEHLSKRFSTPLKDKFADLELAAGLGGAPVFEGSSALFECQRRYAYSCGDHIIFVGEIQRYRYSQCSPLVFHGGRYANFDYAPLLGQPMTGAGP